LTCATGDAHAKLASVQELERYLAGYPAIGGNRAQSLVDGRAAYPSMLAAIAAARTSVLLESYIFRADGTGARFLTALCARAAAGARVRVLVDGVGSRQIPPEFWAPLLAAGGAVEVFRPLHRFMSLGWWRFLWKRDHRKLLVVDERVAFIGGVNIADDYAPSEEGGGGWHDAHVRIEGPAAAALGQLFLRTWHQVTSSSLEVFRYGGRQPRPLDAPRNVEAAGDVSVQILEGSLTRRHSVRKAYLHAIRTAERTIRITNAYCIPDRMVRRALALARQRGVRVQMLLAGATDIAAVQYASHFLYRRMLDLGIEIYEWTEHVLHAKTAVIDGVWCSIGSYNLDRRSLVHNLEANIGCVDPTLGAALDEQFERDVMKSKPIDPKTWHRRSPLAKILELLFYQLRYLL